MLNFTEFNKYNSISKLKLIANGRSMVTGQIVMCPVELVPNIAQELLFKRKCLEDRNAQGITQSLKSVITAHAQVKHASPARFRIDNISIFRLKY